MLPTPRTPISLLLVLVTTLLVGCGPQIPTEAEIHGIWGNLDAGTWRVLSFSDTGTEADVAGMSSVYRIHVYADASTPEEVQRGVYDVATEEGAGFLVTTVTWDTDMAFGGMSFANEILGFTASTGLRLDVPGSPEGERTYEPFESLP